MRWHDHICFTCAANTRTLYCFEKWLIKFCRLCLATVTELCVKHDNAMWPRSCISHVLSVCAYNNWYVRLVVSRCDMYPVSEWDNVTDLCNNHSTCLAPVLCSSMSYGCTEVLTSQHKFGSQASSAQPIQVCQQQTTAEPAIMKVVKTLYGTHAFSCLQVTHIC